MISPVRYSPLPVPHFLQKLRGHFPSSPASCDIRTACSARVRSQLKSQNASDICVSSSSGRPLTSGKATANRCVQRDALERPQERTGDVLERRRACGHVTRGPLLFKNSLILRGAVGVIPGSIAEGASFLESATGRWWYYDPNNSPPPPPRGGRRHAASARSLKCDKFFHEIGQFGGN